MSAPVNDNFADRITISGSAGEVAPVVIDDATTEGSEPGELGMSIWFQWTATFTGVLRLDATGTVGPQHVNQSRTVEVYTGSVLASLTPFDPFWPEPVFTTKVNRRSYNVTSGTVYVIRVAVDTLIADPGDTLGLAWKHVVTPANNDFANAIVIGGSNGEVAAVDMDASTVEPGTPDDFAFGGDIWYRFTAPVAGRYLFTSTGDAGKSEATMFNSVDALSGTVLADLVAPPGSVNSGSVFGDDPPETGFAFAIVDMAATERVYLKMVASSSLNVGSLGLKWTLDVPPENDDFANAVELDASGEHHVNLTAATIEPSENDFGYEGSAWYHWDGTGTDGAPLDVNILTGLSVPEDVVQMRIWNGPAGTAMADLAYVDEVGAYSGSPFWTGSGSTYPLDLSLFDAGNHFWVQVGRYSNGHMDARVRWGSLAVKSAQIVGNVLTLIYSRYLDEAYVPSVGAFELRVGPTQEPRTPTTVLVAGNRVTLIFAESVSFGDAALTLYYDKDDAGLTPLREAVEFIEASSFTALPVSNLAQSPDIWAQRGLFVVASDFADPTTWAEMALSHGFQWVAVLAADGTTLVNTGNITAWMAEARAAGMTVGIWHVLRTDPVAEAAVAAERIETNSAQFYIANPEAEYKTDTSGVRDRAQQFVDAYDALGLTIPKGFITYGAASGENILGSALNPAAGTMDWAAWFNDGWQYIPEAYANESADYEMTQVLHHAANASWPTARITPALGIYDGGALGRLSGADYAARLTAVGWTGGFAVFDAEQATEEDLAALGVSGGGGGGSGGVPESDGLPTDPGAEFFIGPWNRKFAGTPIWRFVVTNRVGETITFLDRLCTERNVTRILDKPAVASGRVPSDSREVNLPYQVPTGDPFLHHNSRRLYCMRREAWGLEDPWVCRFAGIIMQLEDEATDPPTSSFTAYDPWEYLYARPLINSEGEIPGVNGLKYNNTRGDVIAKQLLVNSVAANGPVGIDFDSGTFQHTAQVTIEFQQATSVGEAWEQLCATGTIDIVLEPVYDPATPNVLAKMHTYKQAGKRRDAAIFAWDLPGRSIAGMSRMIDGTPPNLANKLRFYASGTGRHLPSATVTRADSVSKYGQYWYQQNVVSERKTGGNAAIELMALAEAILRENGHKTLSFDPMPERSPMLYREYDIGDIVPVWASRNLREPIEPTLTDGVPTGGYQRVYAIPVDIDDNGAEHVGELQTTLEAT